MLPVVLPNCCQTRSPATNLNDFFRCARFHSEGSKRGLDVLRTSLFSSDIDAQSRPILFRLGSGPEVGRRNLFVIRHGDDQDGSAGLYPIPQVKLPGLVRLELERVGVSGLDFLNVPEPERGGP